jgi:hypothetical protein
VTYAPFKGLYGIWAGFIDHGAVPGKGLKLESKLISESIYNCKALFTSTSPTNYLKNYGASSTNKYFLFRISKFFQRIGNFSYT